MNTMGFKKGDLVYYYQRSTGDTIPCEVIKVNDESAISTRLKQLAGVKPTTKKNKLRSGDTTKLDTFKNK